MTIDEFLEKYVEGYLFEDLKNMAEISLPDGQHAGAASYSMISASLAGMELLGGLLSHRRFCTDSRSGNQYFNYYWDNCLAPHSPCCKEFGPIVRKLVRHGIAHTAIAKPRIHVYKGQLKESMEVHSHNGSPVLCIDAAKLYEDLKGSYYQSVRPILDGSAKAPLTTKPEIEKRLHEMLSEYEKETDELFGKIQPLQASTEPKRAPAVVPIRPTTTGSVAPTLAAPIEPSGGTISPDLGHSGPKPPSARE